MSFTSALIILAVVVLIIGRRLAGEPLEARKLLLMPVLLLVYGVYQLGKVGMGNVHHLTLDLTLLAIGGVVALIGGAARGFTIKVYERAGHLWSRYSVATVAVWAGLIALRFGQSFLDRMLGADSSVLTASLAPMVALSLAGEAAVVGARALRSGTPFAPKGARRDPGLLSSRR